MWSTEAVTFTAMHSGTKALLSAYDAMEADRLKHLGSLDLNDARHGTAPKDGGWSVAQVCLHLSGAEGQGLSYMRKKLSGGALDRATFNTMWRASLLRMALWLPIRYKAPSILKEPDAQISFTDSMAQWATVRRELRQLLADFPTDKIDAEVFKHPAAGKITIMQTIRFMREHQNHHMKQLRRILNSF